MAAVAPGDLASSGMMGHVKIAIFEDENGVSKTEMEKIQVLCRGVHWGAESAELGKSRTGRRKARVEMVERVENFRGWKAGWRRTQDRSERKKEREKSKTKGCVRGRKVVKAGAGAGAGAGPGEENARKKTRGGSAFIFSERGPRVENPSSLMRG
ncbi:hypothetical protein RUM43_012836 [Polyplax serrata]|uniref:Uncharacterized protein n=1 Tax=Polyplax serrata TaxID=468196 RepID=A0AAN8PJM1_POLSC